MCVCVCVHDCRSDIEDMHYEKMWICKKLPFVRINVVVRYFHIGYLTYSIWQETGENRSKCVDWFRMEGYGSGRGNILNSINPPSTPVSLTVVCGSHFWMHLTLTGQTLCQQGYLAEYTSTHHTVGGKQTSAHTYTHVIKGVKCWIPWILW